jgi:hypothetical protein
MRNPEAIHPISGLRILMRPLTKCGGISIAIRVYVGVLLGRR